MDFSGKVLSPYVEDETKSLSLKLKKKKPPNENNCYAKPNP